MNNVISKYFKRLFCLLVTICFHAFLLGGFIRTDFGHGFKGTVSRPMSRVEVKQPAKRFEITPVMPIPAVETPDIRSSALDQIIPGKPLSSADIIPDDGTEFVTAKPSKSLAGDEIVKTKPIEFFGLRGEGRTVCYLVDCSGSMKGLFSHVREQLKASVRALPQDHYFYIIFMQNNRLIEFGGGKLLRASRKAKLEAGSFIDSPQPTGPTDALWALERAMRITGPGDRPAGQIYLLTDGLDLYETGSGDNMVLSSERDGEQLNEDFRGGEKPDSNFFIYKLLKIRARLAPDVRINTIGFWPGTNDKSVLEAIAEKTGGRFINIGN
jgi:hypothetical protein